ncbi:hypothetical protein [Clostridium peptidivorans]|uniref:hypothetical protein n=1 Tax=Clostridium peptidivorans TaxID=100174 RepID=UPI000BE2EC3C|nr:hypothetical protein [Clostridium peptidivorans]
MNYKFVTVPVYAVPKLVMEFEEDYSMLTNIFMEIVLGYDSKMDWLKAINDIMSGTDEKHDFGVPGFGAEVGKEKTIIYCDFTDEEFEISTYEFKKLSEIWFDKLEEFEKTGKID